MVLTAKFGCARLYSRIIAPDTESRRLNLQACYAEYQWIIAYAQKFDVQIFQEELALCREMVSAAAVHSACSRCFVSVLPLSLGIVSLADRLRLFPRKSLRFRRTAPCTPLLAGDCWTPWALHGSLLKVGEL